MFLFWTVCDKIESLVPVVVVSSVRPSYLGANLQCFIVKREYQKKGFWVLKLGLYSFCNLFRVVSLQNVIIRNSDGNHRLPYVSVDSSRMFTVYFIILHERNIVK